MIVLIGSQKGGVGKSTLAANLAVAWQGNDHDVVLIEADPTVSTCSMWAADREESGLPSVLVMKRTGKITETLRELDRKYDVVVVDLPGKDSQEMRSAMLVADLLLIPTRASQPDIDSTNSMPALLELNEAFNPDMRVLVVLNGVSSHPWSDEEQESRDALAEAFPEDVARVAVHDRKAFRNAISEGKSVLESSDRKAAYEIEQLLKEVEEKLNA